MGERQIMGYSILTMYEPKSCGFAWKKNCASLEDGFLRNTLTCSLEAHEWELLVLLTCCPVKQCNLERQGL